MKKIKENHMYDENRMIFEINDKYDNLDVACKARLDLFELIEMKRFDKILYLDTDILIRDDVNKVFEICVHDTLYVLEEGQLNDIYHGGGLFGNELDDFNGISTAFTSGILLFNNCEKVDELFTEIKKDIVNRLGNYKCFDQPYIIYNAFKFKMYNNQKLKKLAVNNDDNISSDKVIHHFPGFTGEYLLKIEKMTQFLNSLNSLRR
jgi:lipopolysaccharide biosynthesis glycosyltransferase